jgi:hypothetical protein
VASRDRAGVLAMLASVTTVHDTLTDATGAPVPGVTVTVALVAGPVAYVTADRRSVVREARTLTGADGRWAVDLVPNVAITPAGTYYEVTARLPGPGVLAYRLLVPEAPGPVWAYDALAEPLPQRQPPLPVGYQTPVGFLTGGLYVGADPPPPAVRREGTVWVPTTQTLEGSQ